MNNFSIIHLRFQNFNHIFKERNQLSSDLPQKEKLIPFIQNQLKLLEKGYDSTCFQQQLQNYINQPNLEPQYQNIILQAFGRIAVYQHLVNIDLSYYCQKFIKHPLYAQSVIQYVVQAERYDILDLLAEINIQHKVTVTYCFWGYYVLILNNQQLFNNVLTLTSLTLYQDFFMPTGTDSILSKPSSFYFCHIAIFAFSTIYHQAFLDIFLSKIELFDRKVRYKYLNYFFEYFYDAIFIILDQKNGLEKMLNNMSNDTLQQNIINQLLESEDIILLKYMHQLNILLKKLSVINSCQTTEYIQQKLTNIQQTSL